MRRISQKYVIILLIITILSLTYGIKYLNKTKYEELPEVKLKERVEKEKSFAIMISDDGNNYQEYKNNEWPGDNYKYKEAQCIDSKGNLVDDVISFESDKATIKTDKTIYCTLYFDHKETMEILRENDINNSLSENIEGGMYRYQGTNNEVNNYVCLNEECISSNRYRIIGINENNEIKLIKEESAGQTNFGDSDDIEILYPDSNVYKLLNTNEDSFYNSLSNNIKEMIVEKDWYYPMMDWDTFVSASKDLNLLYKIENGLTKSQFEFKVSLSEEGKDGVICSNVTGGNKHLNEKMCYVLKHKLAKSIKSNISLMYMYDYYFSVQKGGLNCNYHINNAEKCKTSWLYNDMAEWLITGRGFGIDRGLSSNYTIIMEGLATSDGSVTSNLYTSKRHYRPVFYINNIVKITSGDGTKINPFILKIN